MSQGFDVVVIGGAAIGSAVACFLAAQPGFKGRVPDLSALGGERVMAQRPPRELNVV